MLPVTPGLLLCDLDGVVWKAQQPIEGSPPAVERLRAAGWIVWFVTNNSAPTVADLEASLASIGIPAEGEVLTSSQAAAGLVEPGERVLAVGGPGVVEALGQRGAAVVDPRDPPSPVDAVVVGLRRDFDFAMLHRASTAIRDGARFVATNEDPTFPTPTGLEPGNGALVAAIATAAGVAPAVAGKPHRPMADLVRARVGERWDATSTIMVGDRPMTDGAFAGALGCPFAVVRSGVTAPGIGVAASYDAASLAVLADRLLGIQ